MNDFAQQFQELAKKISFMESRRIKFGKFLRKINDDFKIGPDEEIADVRIINNVSEDFPENVSVVGIDGGIIRKSCHGLDIFLMRACAVNFVYIKGKLHETNYFPSSTIVPEPKIVLEPFSENEMGLCHNFERQIMETSLATEAIKKLKPDIALLDGSVLPSYAFPTENSSLREYYKEMIEKYIELFSVSKETGNILAGVVEDSRAVRFCEILKKRVLASMCSDLARELEQILDKTKDSNLLFYALNKGERTCLFNYSKNPEMNHLLKEFEPFKKSFFSFYIKTVDFDRPLRVDLLSFGNPLEEAKKISSLLMKTSKHSGYGLPAVLIEADQRAKLNEKDIDIFYHDLLRRVGNVPSLFKLRRDIRPF